MKRHRVHGGKAAHVKKAGKKRGRKHGHSKHTVVKA